MSVDIPELRDKAMRLASTNLPAAQLLQRCGDEIQQLRTQRDALLLVMPTPAPAVLETPHG